MAHRRVRHLNPASAGATGVWDSRFSTGATVGGAVSSWGNRVTGGLSATQSTSANQPTLQVSSENGNEVIRFDGTNDKLQTSGVSQTTLNYTIIVAFKYIATGATKVVFLNGNTGSNGYGFLTYTSKRTIIYGNVSGGFLVDGNPTTSWEIWSASRPSSTTSFWVNGVSTTITNNTLTPKTPATSMSFAGEGATNQGNLDFGAAITLSSINDSLRRRLENSLAFTWKISCS